jgi:sugar O-acyltransferase (sialic acid O-acetyltransferase NeuD family)
MTKKKIVLIGGGGHCKACIDVIEQENHYQIIGIVDSDSSLKEVLGYPVIGGDESISTLVDSNTWFLITVGQIKSFAVRLKIAELLKRLDAQLASIVSPTAYVSKHAQVGLGSIVMHKAIVNAAAQVGEHCILNTLANVEHDVVIEDFCHISTGAIINGSSIIKRGSFVGSNATISNNILLKENSIISAGKFIKR